MLLNQDSKGNLIFRLETSSEKSAAATEGEKTSKNWYNALVSDPKNVFYVTNKITMN